MTYYKDIKRYSKEDLEELGLKALAVRRVNQAVKNGTMVPDNKCQVCYAECKTVAHHWNGHNNWFDIWWVCTRCNANLPHTGISLVDARKIIVGRYFKQPMHRMDWLHKQTRPCSMCGIEDKAGSMVVVAWEYALCQRCADDLEVGKHDQGN